LSREKYELDLQSKLVYAERQGNKQIINLLKRGKSLEEIEYRNRLSLSNMLIHAKRKGRQDIIDMLKSGKSPKEIIREYSDN